MKKIDHFTYCQLLKIAIANNPQIALNVTRPVHSLDNQYFKSSQGISVLYNTGLLGGLARYEYSYKKKENLTDIHQKVRIKNGGYFLECFNGPLVEMYKKNGFHIVAKIPFNPDYAPKNWQLDSILKGQPDIVFMSIYPKTIKTFNDYQSAFNYTKLTNK